MYVIWAMAGGALGAGARYLLVDWSGRALGAGFWGVAIANLIGSFLIGLIFGSIAAKVQAGLEGLPPKMAVFLATGVLGGFTTFSAFSLDAVRMIEDGKLGAAALYVGGSVLGGLILAAAGFAAGKAAFA